MGVVSNGMLCSGDELNLTGDADGILILPADAPLGVAAGRPLRRRRPRCRRQAEPRRRAEPRRARSRGRRDPAAGRSASRRPIRPSRARRSTASSASRSATRTCARGSSGAGSVACAIGPSPDRVQMRLRAAGVRPISNVVDASNYVMLELGKPIHTYDAAAVGGERRPAPAHRPASGGRRADRDARPRRARRSTPTRSSSPIRTGRSGSPASWATRRRR